MVIHCITRYAPRCSSSTAGSDFHHNRELPLDQFCIKSKNKDGRTAYCKECHRTSCKKHYIDNKESYHIRNSKRRKTIKEFILKYKFKKVCIRCGFNKWWVLHFHHLDANKKDFNISRSTTQCWSLDKISDEINKCELLCPNCHTLEHTSEPDCLMV